MRKLRVLALMHEDHVPPAQLDGLTDKQIAPWKTEYDVLCTVEELGHEARALGLADNLAVLREAVLDWKPHLVFNLLEEFSGLATYVPYVLGYLELMKVPYTGCNPRGLILTEHKGLMRKILKHHRIPMPDFAVFPLGRAVRRPRHLSFPLIVKSATQHGSVGIAQASIVQDDEKLIQRVQYVHHHLQSDAIAEQYIEGRELYVGVIGHRRLQAFPIWELRFEKLADDVPRIATEKIKWDLEYQKKAGVEAGPAKNLPADLAERIGKLAKRVYKTIELTGYARMDVRLTESGKFYLLEPNPNPDIALDEEFAESAHAAGLDYAKLIHRILGLGLSYRANRAE